MLMGVKADQIYLQVLVIVGLLAAAAGIMISSLATLSPQMEQTRFSEPL
jgi:branched-chain amino acid transport system permease protein